MDINPSTFAAALAAANGHPDPEGYAKAVIAILEKPEDEAVEEDPVTNEHPDEPATDEGEQHV